MTKTSNQFERNDAVRDISEQPIFIMSAWKRSGTNFLADLLRLHPSFQIAAPLWEDFLTASCPLLDPFVDKLCSNWRWWLQEKGECENEIQNELYRHLGNGLLSFMYSRLDSERRLLCKTPVATHLDRFFALFPDSRLVILVRDGRDVVESAKRSWPNNSYGYYMRQWAVGARNIISFVNSSGLRFAHNWMLVRYEDLLVDQKQIRRLVNFVGIDEDDFPWDEIDKLPVRGSSIHRSNRNELSWERIEKPETFRPVERWANWGVMRKWQFKHLAGHELRHFGYVDSSKW